MSRRSAGPDKSEQNRATLKQLVKLEGNKQCADCKRNKHPRWASWNLGIFICIRCSGIHRSMGVHISRVKSVDLDSWTDEQMASMIKWGNARANRYWEDKLAAGHVPNEAKIENFIRTKYDSRRWVMDGPMPDPSTLDDGAGDDDVPLNVVKANIERSGSLRNGGAAAAGGLTGPPRARPQEVDLFGDASEPAPARPSTTGPPQGAGRVASQPGRAPAAPPKQTRPGDSLLGLDFFGGPASAPPRPASATSGMSTPGAPGRTDLKNSILSLYASKPAAVPQPQQQPQQQQARSNMDLFGGMQSPPLASPTQQSSNSQSLGDAFGSLSFSSQPQAKPAPFSQLSSPTIHGREKSSLSGGSFFDAKPAPPPKQSAPAPRKTSNGFGDFGDFSSAPSPPPQSAKSTDLFGLSSAPSQSKPAAPAPQPAPRNPSFPTASAFNLSAPKSTPAPAAPTTATSNFSTFSNADAWGSNDAWATPDPPAQTQPAPPPKQAPPAASSYKAPAITSTQTGFDGGWGDPEPAAQGGFTSSSGAGFGGNSSGAGTGGGFSVQQDEEFGGWSHASPVAQAPPSKQGGGGSGGGQDDLFGNVWG